MLLRIHVRTIDTSCWSTVKISNFAQKRNCFFRTRTVLVKRCLSVAHSVALSQSRPHHGPAATAAGLLAGFGSDNSSPSTIRPLVVGTAVRVLPVLVAGRHARRSTHVSGAHIGTPRRFPCSVTGQHWYCSGEPCPQSVRFVCCVSV